jgi:hypothetical protein
MTESAFPEMMAAPADPAGFDAMDPANVSPLVVWLGSAESRSVTGRIFEIAGGKLSVQDGWRPGAELDKGARWTPAELGEAVRELLADSPPPLSAYGT